MVFEHRNTIQLRWSFEYFCDRCERCGPHPVGVATGPPGECRPLLPIVSSTGSGANCLSRRSAALS